MNLRSQRINRTGNSQFMKELNMAQVLGEIRRNGPISRIDIARATELSPPTVSSLVEELLGFGVIQETGTGTSIGGRRPVLLSLNPDRAYALGVDFADRVLKLAAVNLAGTVFAQTAEVITEVQVQAPTAVITRLVDLVRAIIAQVQREHQASRLLGMGVSFPGIVTLPVGNLYFSGHYPWENFPLMETLRTYFPSMPLTIENNVRAMALAEKWFGAGRQVEDLIVVRLGRGIGAGIIMQGEIFRGACQGAGEIGHLTVDPSGPECTCGNRGCLEAVAAEAALLARWQELGKPTQVNGEALFTAAQRGDAAARQVLGEARRYLGIGLAGLINLFSPSLVVLASSIPGALAHLIPQLEQEPAMQSLPWQARQARLLPTGLGQDGSVIGAATLILSRFFAAPRSFLAEEGF